MASAARRKTEEEAPGTVRQEAVFDAGAAAKAMRLLTGGIDKSQILVLNNVLVAVRGGVATFTGTNLVHWIAQQVPVADGGDFAITVPAQLLSGILGNFAPGAQARLAVQDGKAILSSGRSRYTLPTMPPEDFPLVDLGEQAVRFAMPAATLRRMIAALSFAMGRNDTRTQLNGLYLAPVEGRLHIAATNGLQCGYAAIDLPAGAEALPGIILPERTVKLLSALIEGHDGEVAIAADGGKIAFEAGSGRRLLSKLIEGTYPNYLKLYAPQEGVPVHHVQMEADAVDAALQRLLLLADDKYRSVRFAFSGDTATLSTASAAQGAGVEEIAVACEDGGDFEFWANGAHLRENLFCLKGAQLHLAVGHKEKPATMEALGQDSIFYAFGQVRG